MIQLKRFLKRVGQNLWRGFLGVLIALGVATMVLGPLTNTMNAYAEPETGVESSEDNATVNDANGVAGSEDDGADVDDEADDADGAGTSSETAVTTTTNKPAMAPTTTSVNSGCKDSLGALGWLICPLTEKISEAVDWLYDKIEVILLINPVEMTDGEPIYELWKYFRAVTNVVFIIFLLVVVWSQLTGVGISNYGVKKALPKLIIAAVMVNLSFIVCSIAVDASNIIGNGLRSVFEGIETTAMGGEAAATGGATASLTDIYAALAGGTAVAIGAAVIAIETGAIWMLIPVALGAIVAVASGLVTIALRQAVVALLIMVSPLAIVAYILPNTEQWFKKWRQLLTKMLVFYPMFSLLFGAANLAGWAIIASAKSGFTLMLGAAVQIFPLFFSWKLMQMSGTFLNTINGWMRGVAARPLSANRAWAESHREATRQKYLASENAYTPSLRLMQFLNNRRIARGLETKENEELVATRGAAYAASRHYDANGVPTREGERDYDRQARIMEYQRVVLQDKNNFNKGLGVLEATKNRASAAQLARLGALDTRNVNASDFLKVEQARTEKIDYENAAGFHGRMQAAVNAHFDDVDGFEMKNGKYVLDANGKRVARRDYKFHFEQNSTAQAEAMARYREASAIMEGSELDSQYAAATAAAAYDTQAQIIMKKFQKYFELTPPTKDVEYRLKEFSQYQQALDQWNKAKEKGEDIDPYKRLKATNNIDAIISGLRVINQRGDTDIVKDILDDLVNEEYGGVELGTRASQSLASFLMFEVKDNDPFLRRFGKYINLETANAYNKNVRQEMNVTYDEYIKGFHVEPNGKLMYAKRPMTILMEGTSLDNIERTAFSNLDGSLKKAYGFDEKHLDKEWDVEGYLKKREEIQKSIAPQFLSASLKWLSGSEQLKSAVTFLTGYSNGQKKDANGDVIVDQDGNPEYEWTPVWEDGKSGFIRKLEDEDHATDEEKEENKKYNEAMKDRVKDFFRKKTEQYYKDQTPSQLLKLRSDYVVPTRRQFADGWLEFLYKGRSNEKLMKDPEFRKSLHEYASELEEYGRMREEAGEEPLVLNNTFADQVTAKRVREILGENTMRRIAITADRSSAANETKAVPRMWFGIDDAEYKSSLINKKPSNSPRKPNKPEYQAGEPSGSDVEAAGPYNLYGNFRDWMGIAAQDADLMRDIDRYYRESSEALENFQMDVIKIEYDRFYENNKQNIHSVLDLEEELSRLMEEYPENGEVQDEE